MANHNLPTQNSGYLNFVTELDARFDDLCFGLDPARTTIANLPTNSVGWSSSGSKWQRWTGTAWTDLATTYSISINGVAATATALANARTINGVSFNGTANISVNTNSDVTFNNGGSGADSGTTFNGSSAPVISYNTVGAPSAAGVGATGTWGISITGNANTATTAASVTNGVYTIGNQSIADIKTFTSAPVVPGLNGGQLAGTRNKIINGKMEIAQRGTTFNTPTGYTLDRWQTATTMVLGVGVTQSTDVPAGTEFQNSLRWVVAALAGSPTSTQTANIQQVIEGFNARDLNNKTFTLGFWVKSAKTGVHCVAFTNSGNDRSYVTEYTVLVANTWEFKKVTVTGGFTTAGTWNTTNGVGLRVTFTLASGTSLQTTPNAWQTGNFKATVNQVNLADSINNVFALTGVQLEVGTVASSFEHRNHGIELALCQRYFQKSYDSTIDPGTIGISTFATVSQAANVYILFSTNLPVVMRAAPTAVVYSPNSTRLSGYLGIDSLSALANIAASTSCVRINTQYTVDFDRIVSAHYTLSAEL